MDLLRKFRNKYKVSNAPVINEKSNKVQEEAKQLAMKLNTIFIMIPVLKPYDEKDTNKVKLLQEHIDIINDIINSKNELIINNELYLEVIEILKELLKNNNDGIQIDSDLISKSRIIQKFYYSFQDQNYWEEKPF